MTKVALLVGVSEYQPGLSPLPKAQQDIDAMVFIRNSLLELAEVFMQAETCGL